MDYDLLKSSLMNEKEVKVAVVGVGNCASSFLQGLTYYQQANEKQTIVGLMHPVLAGYSIKNIKVVAAFDVNSTKVGKDLAEAIYAKPNNTKIFAQVQKTGVIVQNAPVFDGIGEYMKDVIVVAKQEIPNPVEFLKKSGADVLVCYLPVGSQEAVTYWASVCLQAKVGMVNCLPVFIASDPKWRKQFIAENVPIVGDDIKSQVGATIVHRVLTNLFLDRGMPIDRTYQLNVGGNADFQNMLERKRLKSKEISKTRAVTSQIELHESEIDAENIHIGPSDWVPWLQDNKVAFIRIESRHFGDLPMNIEVRLSVEDSANSAGVVIDAIRCCKIALDNHIGGPLIEASSYLMKSPPVQFTDAISREKLEEYIERYSSSVNMAKL